MNFLKTTVLGGLFILLPLMLLWIGLKEIGGLLALMAAPIADILVDLFPAEFFEKPDSTRGGRFLPDRWHLIHPGAGSEICMAPQGRP